MNICFFGVSLIYLSHICLFVLYLIYLSNGCLQAGQSPGLGEETALLTAFLSGEESVQCAVCSVQCAVCNVQYSVCSVQCRVYSRAL